MQRDENQRNTSKYLTTNNLNFDKDKKKIVRKMWREFYSEKQRNRENQEANKIESLSQEIKLLPI